MAKREVLIDDLDGSEGAETIRYALDRKEYEIDLSERHARWSCGRRGSGEGLLP